jgi:hypothetical protein
LDGKVWGKMPTTIYKEAVGRVEESVDSLDWHWRIL